jgi:hypothetical protein
MVRTDNFGSIFMDENPFSKVRTRHIDTWYHFIRENVENGHITILLLRINENDADIFTKNMNKIPSTFLLLLTLSYKRK